MNKVGILAPDGKLIPCESYDHLNIADKLVKEMEHPVNNKLEAEEYLQQLGYIVVRARDVYGLIGYLDDNDQLICLTNAQKRWLEENYDNFPIEKQRSIDDLLDKVKD